MGLSEADTRAKLIDPCIHHRGWTEDLIRREETAGMIVVDNGRAKSRAADAWATWRIAPPCLPISLHWNIRMAPSAPYSPPGQ